MRRGERLVGLFLLAAFLFSPVAIGFFQKPVLVAGVPALLLYVFAAWGVVVALLALAARRGPDEDGQA
ncbi:MAG: hypothetical protein FJX69_01780 [Alphaproteobacteria bacterium]|nr:hypothetical protein [Alphaproteobacteria bacterium]MBM3628808.1 hypothetical protein [Alphaproteobacteria bacterium]